MKTTQHNIRTATVTLAMSLLLAGMSAHAASLVSWWTGQDNARDVVGSNVGTLANGAGFALGQHGRAFSFDGVDDYVSVSHHPSLRPGTGSFTLLAWIKTTNGIGWRSIVSQYEGSGSSFGYGAFGGSVLDGRLRFDLRDTDIGGDPAPDVGGGQKLVGTNNVVDGAFHHVAFVRDIESGEMRIYLDCVLEASALLNAGAAGAIQDDDGEDDLVIIGGGRDTRSTTVGAIFDGFIDEVQYYSGALTAQQICDASRGFRVDIALYAGVTVEGTVGRTYRIEYLDTLGQSGGWIAVTNVVLPSTPYVWIDLDTPRILRRFYRAVELP